MKIDYGRPERALADLQAVGFALNSVDRYQRTLVHHIATYSNTVPLARALVESGYELGQRSCGGADEFAIAAKCNNLSMMVALHELGADAGGPEAWSGSTEG